MKKRTLLPLLLLGAFSAQARFATSLTFPVTSAPYTPYVQSVVYNFTGYMGGQELIPPYSNGGVNYIPTKNPYFFFTSNGPYSATEEVSVSLESADPEVQLVGGFDEAPNVWQLQTPDNPSSNLSCTLRVERNYQVYYYNIVLVNY